MSALVFAAANLLLFLYGAHAQWVDRPVLSLVSTSTADFSIATASPNDPVANMDGAVFDAFPSSSPNPTQSLAAALATGAAKSTAAAIAAAGSSIQSDDDDQGECRLLGPFALLVQLALGGLALMSLVYKRWRERPQRPLKIWFFDASKQVFGSVLVHVANVFMSMLTSGRFSIKVEPAAVGAVARSLVTRVAAGEGNEYTPNPCSFYLLNLAIDTTVGIPILILLLRIFTALVAYTPLGQPPESIQSGNYGNPPNAWWWLKQSVIYFCGLFGMKFCVLILFLMMPWISRVGDWALRWTEGNEKVQIVFVMMLFPLIMNALQYYIIDSFIKKAASKEDTEGHEGLPPSEGSYQRVAADDVEIDGHGDEEQGGAEPQQEGVTKMKTDTSREEYNPERDGDRSTTIGGGSTETPEGKVPRELYPKE